MRNVLIFTMGVFTGSLVTYIIMKRKTPEEIEVEYLEENYEDNEQAVPLSEIITEVKQERVDYSNLVENLYSPKNVSLEKRPYLITEDQYHESNIDYEKCEVTYFAGDGTLANDDLIFDDLDYAIGLDNLYYFGTNDLEDPNVMYIRNDAAGTDYRVESVNACYEDHYPQEHEDEE